MTATEAEEPVGRRRARAVVLVAGDDPRSRRYLAGVLRDDGYVVESVARPERAFSVARRRNLAAAILDPDGADPVETVAALRRRTVAPILFIARGRNVDDAVRVLDAGADDYITKPYSIPELLARLRAALRRRPPHHDSAGPVVTPHFTLDVADRRLTGADGSEISLTATEWRIVETLTMRPGHLVTYAELLETVWGAQALDKTQYLRVYMTSIRRKIEPTPHRPRYFHTVSGVGFRFAVPEASP